VRCDLVHSVVPVPGYGGNAGAFLPVGQCWGRLKKDSLRCPRIKCINRSRLSISMGGGEAGASPAAHITRSRKADPSAVGEAIAGEDCRHDRRSEANERSGDERERASFTWRPLPPAYG
jgi:hypothetical protein